MKDDILLSGEQQFVGAYLPPQVADYLRLLSVNWGQSVQKTLQRLIDDKRVDLPENQLVANLANQAVTDWRYRLERGILSGNKQQQQAFIYQLRAKLKRKKINEIYIQNIIAQAQRGITT